jgi:hypothetical protein
MAVQSLHFQLIVKATPKAQSGYNFERFLLTLVPLTTPSLIIMGSSFGLKFNFYDFEPPAAMLFC